MLRPIVLALAFALLFASPAAPARARSLPNAGDGVAPALAFAAGVDVASVSSHARTETLLQLVERADARFGVAREASEFDALAALEPRLASVTADLLSALLDAADARDVAYARVTAAELASLVDDEGSAR